MKELVAYIALVSLLIACSYLVYKTVFTRVTLHGAQRFALLFLLAGSFAAPVCRITVDKQIPARDPLPGTATGGVAAPSSALPTGPTSQQIATQSTTSRLLFAAGTIYMAGVVFLISFSIAGVVKVRRIMRRSVNRYIHNGMEVLLVRDKIPPFSFGGKIVMSQSDYDENAEMIIRHEAVHIRHRHRVDILVTAIASALLWFNPFVWLLRHELILIHEFTADRGVVRSGVDAKRYQYLLISKSARRGGFIPLANHLCTRNLHKRIKTMKSKTSRASALKLLLLIPVTAAVLAALAESRYIVAESGAGATDTVFSGDSQLVVTNEPFHCPFEIRNGVLAPFGERVNPVSGRTRVHSGIDVLPSNDTVRAPLSGVVKSASYGKNYGNRLVIAHSGGFETAYAHLERFLVAKGAKVNGGEPIAIVGNTGMSTGKHLHFECSVNGESVDPMKVLPLGF
jgi:murein DD-endopeptidase MepM/ murein hydrolase activator NlpD